MSTHKHTRLTAVRARVNRIWSELDYASRRMIDIRTGAAFETGQEKSRRPAAHRPRSRPLPPRWMSGPLARPACGRDERSWRSAAHAFAYRGQRSRGFRAVAVTTQWPDAAGRMHVASGNQLGRP